MDSKTLSENLQAQKDINPVDFFHFTDLNLRKKLAQGLQKCKYSEPKVIQRLSLPTLLKNEDVNIVCSQRSGKTLAYCISILQRIDIEDQNIQSIVIVKDHIDAQKVKCVLQNLGLEMNPKIQLLLDQHTPQQSKQCLLAKPQIVIASIHRLRNLCNTKLIDLSKVKSFVVRLESLDESFNKCLLDEIMEKLPQEAQRIFISQTESQNNFLEKYIRGEKFIICKGDEATLDGIRQYYIAIDKEEWKLEVLQELYESIDSMDKRVQG